MEKIIFDKPAVKEGLLKLLEIKDSDIRILTLQQGLNAVDKGLHSGGAFSAILPLVDLYYGGIIQIDVENPTAPGQDQFVMSKGHAVAAMASVYCDKGYFDPALLKNSRSYESILNGHPGPILPGVQISTGPLGQGVSAAVGFAMIGKKNPKNDVYTMLGDGEMQEGGVWEALMYAADQKLDNYCVIVDQNNGQLDNVTKMIVSSDIAAKLEGFGFRVLVVNATEYEPVLDAFTKFKNERDGRPCAIVCNSTKGFGSFSAAVNGHKITVSPALGEQEIAAQNARRADREAAFVAYYNALDCAPCKAELVKLAEKMNLVLDFAECGALKSVSAGKLEAKVRRAAPRCKKICYDEAKLPKIELGKDVQGSDIVTAAMKAFAEDKRIVSVDSDLSSTSGLYAGVAAVDKSRALNVGIAEANMMNIAEAFAAAGSNVWTSTFCPFFDWRVMRRIAVSYQERLEAIEREDGWLSEGHGLDITFLATAADMDTQTNGATHMGNDDLLFFSQMAHVKVITACDAGQLLAIMKWIAEGNRGLVYLRMLRKASKTIYPADFKFEYGKSYTVREAENAKAVIVSYGRGVFEALDAAEKLAGKGIAVKVVDMPSVDEAGLAEIYKSGAKLILAEQNNGLIASRLANILLKAGLSVDPSRIETINMLDQDGNAQFVHSGTYAQLSAAFDLNAEGIAKRVEAAL